MEQIVVTVPPASFRMMGLLEEYDEDDARTNGVRTHAAAAARLKAKIPFEGRIDIVPNNRSLFVVN